VRVEKGLLARLASSRPKMGALTTCAEANSYRTLFSRDR
jgi:hypothetical protein